MQRLKKLLFRIPVSQTICQSLRHQYVVSILEPHLGGYKHGGDHATEVTPLWEYFYHVKGCRNVLDVGCGEGWHILAMRGIGYEAWGVEGLKKALRNSPVRERIIHHDLTKGPFLFPNRQFDLVWCSEVVEHIEERFVGNVILTLCGNCARYVAMTYADSSGGYHHVNCKPPEYWIRLIEACGLTYNEHLTMQMRNLVREECAGYKHFRDRGLIFEKPQQCIQSRGCNNLFRSNCGEGPNIDYHPSRH